MPEPSSVSKAIPLELNTSINHLANLLSHLPEGLPLNPSESSYHFDLDVDDILEEGYGYALNRRLEIAFEVSTLPVGAPLQLKERGVRLKALVSLLRAATKELIAPSDHEFYISRWIKRITAAARIAGAKIPVKRCANLHGYDRK